MNNRVCTKCKINISLSNHGWCGGCKNASDLAYRNKLEVKKRLQEWRALRSRLNPAKELFTSAKKRAKKLGIPFDLTLDDCKIPEFCPALGIRLLAGQGLINGKRVDNAPSLDKIDPNKGYVRGNVAVISWRANRLKSDANTHELRAISDYMNRS